MEESDFRKIENTLSIEVELTSASEGGRHTPVSPNENWRPDMYFAENNRQFWGEIKVTELISPGHKGNGKLFAVYPKDLEPLFSSGNIIKLFMGAANVGRAYIL